MELRQLTAGAGPDVVLECSGRGEAVLMGLAVLGIGGRLVSVGEGARLELRPSEHLIRKHLNILGSWYTTMDQGRAVQELMLRRRIEPLAFVTHRVALAEAPAAFARVCACSGGVLKTVIVGN